MPSEQQEVGQDKRDEGATLVFLGSRSNRHDKQFIAKGGLKAPGPGMRAAMRAGRHNNWTGTGPSKRWPSGRKNVPSSGTAG